MLHDPKEPRRRARELLRAIDAEVDRSMIQQEVDVPSDPPEALFARARFLERFPALKAGTQPLRAAYVHLHETLGDARAEPDVLDEDCVRSAAEFIEVVRRIDRPAGGIDTAEPSTRDDPLPA